MIIQSTDYSSLTNYLTNTLESSSSIENSTSDTISSLLGEDTYEKDTSAKEDLTYSNILASSTKTSTADASASESDDTDSSDSDSTSSTSDEELERVKVIAAQGQLKLQAMQELFSSLSGEGQDYTGKILNAIKAVNTTNYQTILSKYSSGDSTSNTASSTISKEEE